MSTTTLPNIRVSSDLTVRVRLKDGGVAIDWSTLNNIKAHIYSDAQRALAGRCDVSVDAEDSTLLVCSYAANKPQYVGVNRIVVSAKYMGETKTYDKPAFNFVRWTADQEGEEITIDDPDVDVEIEVEDVTSSILQEAIDAALQAAADAEHAAHLVPLEVLQDCEQATADALEAAATANAAGIDEVQATVDAQVGTPSVDVDLENKVLSLDFHNMKGETGEAAGFGTASASLTEDGGDPGVTVSASGPDTAKQFAFTFKNLKGDKGDKGDQGNTGSSVEYPYELVNNLTTNDATKGLTAAMGVTLEGEVSQLEAKVVNIDNNYSNADLDFSDENDNVLVRFENGHIRTKNFDSTINGQIGVGDTEPDLTIQDPNDNVLVKFEDGHIKTKNFDSSKITERNNRQIVCVGDSLTQGQGTGRVYPTILQSLVGQDYTVVNLGGSGDKIQDIMARTGAFPPVLTADKTIPASGSVSLGGLVSSYDDERKINVMLQNASSFGDVKIMGIHGTLSVSGTYESAVYTFTRIDAGNQVQAKKGCPIFNASQTFANGEIMILWGGSNGLWNDEEELAEMLERIVKEWGGEKFIVVGLTNKNYYYDTDTHSSFTPSILKSTMLKKFGVRYLDMLGYLLTDALTDAGITPTQADTTAIANEEVPPSLLADSIHFNSAGYSVVSGKIYEKLVQLNYL
jgi:lysophospholipase L1-like esterase